jgi:hypothetical protein
MDFAIVNMGNAWTNFQFELMTGDTGKELAKGVNEITKFLRSREAKDLMQMLGLIARIVIRTIRFVIKYKNPILTMLGVAGFYGILMKYPLIFRIFNMEISRSVRLLTLMGTRGVGSFRNLKIAAKGMAKAFFEWLLPLYAAQDIIYGIGQYFLGWNVRSLTGDMLMALKGKRDVEKDPFGSTNLKLNAFSQNLIKDPQLAKKYNEALTSGDWQAVNNLYKQAGGSYSYTTKDFKVNQPGFMGDLPTMNVPTGGAAGIDLDKTENTNNTLTMGDVNIIIQGSSNPNETAAIFQEKMADLFIGALGGVNT